MSCSAQNGDASFRLCFSFTRKRAVHCRQNGRTPSRAISDDIPMELQLSGPILAKVGEVHACLRIIACLAWAGSASVSGENHRRCAARFVVHFASRQRREVLGLHGRVNGRAFYCAAHAVCHFGGHRSAPLQPHTTFGSRAMVPLRTAVAFYHESKLSHIRKDLLIRRLRR